MSLQEFADICAIEQLMSEQLEICPPVRKKALLSSNEIKLLSYLPMWCPNYLVFPQVHLLQMITVDPSGIDPEFMRSNEHAFADDTPENRKKAYWRVFNMVSLLSVDFVLCDKVGTPMYAIELNGAEHYSDPAVIQRDKVKRHVLDSISVKLLTVRNEELSELGKLQARIQKEVA